LELEEEREARWNMLIAKLRESHIRIKESDILAWAQDRASGTYTARLGTKL
jgi:hypothetical protein